jgi:DNA-binding transcriptional LysR family regulator
MVAALLFVDCYYWNPAIPLEYRMELRHLRCFVAIVEERTFSRAAKRLNISQPPLTRQIKNLEAELGVQLFDRLPRNVQLTAAGRAFLPKARSALYESNCAIADARRSADGYDEVVTLAFMSSIMLGEFAPLLAELHRAFPALDVQLRQLRSDEQWEALIDNRIDVGLIDLGVREMSERFRSERIVTERLMHEPLCAALPLDHPLAAARSLSLADLRGERFAILERNLFPGHYDTVLAACKSAGYTPHIAHQGDQMPSVFAYVAAGMAVCIGPQCAAHSWGHLVSFVPLRERPHIDIHMVVKESRLTAALSRLRELARARGKAGFRPVQPARALTRPLRGRPSLRTRTAGA